MMPRIGIDLGGTKIEGVVLGAHGEVLLRRRVATPAGDYPGTVCAVVDLVKVLERETGQSCPVGIGTPGAPSLATGLMKNCNSTVLNGMPLHADLEQQLQREIRLANDADCFALSEAVDGAAAGASSVFGVILGTGVGGGLVFKGHLQRGANAIGGEWGHNPLPAAPEQRACYCGKVNCVETYLCGGGLVETARQYLPGVADAQALAGLASQGDKVALRALSTYCEQLGRALAVVINIVDPEVVVLGGGVSNIDAIYELLPERLAPWIFSDDVRTRIVRAKHGDASGVRGAAWLWSEEQ